MTSTSPQAYLMTALMKLAFAATAVTNAQKVMTNEDGKASLTNAATAVDGARVKVQEALAGLGGEGAECL